MGYVYRPYEQTYRCGGAYSYHGSCGAYDCDSCYPGCNAERETKRDLSNTGYDFNPDDATWSKQVSIRKHTARRDHKDGRVKKGQVYLRSTTRYVDDETGSSYHYHWKSLYKERV